MRLMWIALCLACPVGKECDVDSDCRSGMCNTELGSCVAQSCVDGNFDYLTPPRVRVSSSTVLAMQLGSLIQGGFQLALASSSFRSPAPPQLDLLFLSAHSPLQHKKAGSRIICMEKKKKKKNFLNFQIC